MPQEVQVLTVKFWVHDRYTVVVEFTLILTVGATCPNPVTFGTTPAATLAQPLNKSAFGAVAEVVEIQLRKNWTLVVAAGIQGTLPHTSQSPAVSDILVTFLAVAVVHHPAEPEAILLVMNSPTLPAAALSFVPVPWSMTPPVPLPSNDRDWLVSPFRYIDGLLPVAAGDNTK